MELTQISPTLFFSIIGSVIGLVVWFIRLESRASANLDAIKKIEKEIEKLQLQIEEHRTNQDIHFNLRISQQVELSNERRFSTIENQLSEINHKLDKLAEK